MRRFSTLVAAFSALLVVFSFGRANAQPTVKIGVITDHTGNAAEFARIEELGLELARKEINAKGGILGRKVELLYEDDEDKPALSATKARKLSSEGVPVIIQLSSSTATMQAESATLETKTPHLGANQSSDALVTKVHNPYFFLAGMPASIQFKTLLAYISKKGYKRAAIFTDTSAIAQYIAKAFKKGIERAGGKVVAYEVIETGATDAVPQVQRIRRAHPDVVLDAGNLISESATFYRTYRQLGLKYPIVASYNKSIPRYLKLVPHMLDGVAFLDCFDQDKPETKAFIKRFKAMYKKKPFSLSGYGYNALYLVKAAAENAKSFDREKLRAGFEKIRNFHSVLGAKGTTWNFGPHRHAGFPDKGAVIRLIENNQHGRAIFSGY